MTNVTTLQPNSPGERRGGRKPGVLNLQTRAMRTAMMLAAEESKHSNGTLFAYLKYLADEKPELFAPMLSRLIPIQARIETSAPAPRLDASMNIEEMVSNFAARIKDANYRPKVIDHDDADDERDA